jgi:predicted nucleotidyltransferase
MRNLVADKVCPVFERFPALKLVYFFGSRATGTEGPISDYDFAVYFDGLDKRQMFDCQLRLLCDLEKALGTEHVDVVVLNTNEAPELKYDIIKDGLRIYTIEPFHVIVEPEILNEYFDFHAGLVRNGLTRSNL